MTTHLGEVVNTRKKDWGDLMSEDIEEIKKRQLASIHKQQELLQSKELLK